ncbi:MAG TPA: hypothetical protein VIM49_09370 [Dermatophilaceae bacterium]
MSTQVAVNRPQSPFWKVQAVFDPEGRGGDFAYTIGLHSRGLPELHLWARPTRGDDPAPDWKFSSRDLGALLNEFARLQLSGDLVVGSVVERSFDGGLARVRFEVDPPGNRAALDAFGIARGASVLPIPWSLDRGPKGKARELDEESLAAARMDYAVLARRLSPVGIPPGWKRYKRPRFTPQQRFGPLTALVHARAIAIAQCGSERMSGFVKLALCSRRIGALGHAVAMATAVARGSGRAAAVESVIEESSRLARWLVFEHPLAPCKGALELFAQDPDPQDASGRHDAADALLEVLTLAVTATLMTQVVADVASDEVLLIGLGPWLAAASDTGMSPGPRWLADQSVVDQVEGVLRSSPGAALVDLLEAHDTAMSADVEATGYGELVARLLGMAVSSAALFPLVVVQPIGMPTRPEDATGSAAESPAVVFGRRLTAWASLLTCAMTHRDHLSEDDLSVFARPYVKICPEIGRLVGGPRAT